MNKSPELTELLSSVPELVNAYWRQKHSAMLLSTLGHQLTARGMDVPRTLQGRKLSEVLRTDLSELVSVERVRPDSTIMGVVPKEAAGQATQAFAALAKSEVSDNQYPRLNPAMWAAFTKPIAPGMSRIISFEPHNFVDQQRSPHASELTVTAQDLVVRAELPPADHTRQVFESVRRWLERNHLSMDKLLYSQNTKGGGIKSDNTLLARVMNTLNQEQKRRLLLPLDIVETLSKG